MAKIRKYKRQGKLNWVTVSMALIAAFLIFMGAQYLPMFFTKQEAYRVLDETSSQFHGAKNRYLASNPHLLQLTHKMANDLRLVGIDDPEMEYWIEVDSKHLVRFGVLYSETISWPFDIIAPHSEEIELEYELTLKW